MRLLLFYESCRRELSHANTSTTRRRRRREDSVNLPPTQTSIDLRWDEPPIGGCRVSLPTKWPSRQRDRHTTCGFTVATEKSLEVSASIFPESATPRYMSFYGTFSSGADAKLENRP